MSHEELFTDKPHVMLDGNMAVWYDSTTRRVVFLDFDDDTGISLSMSEWRQLREWANQLADFEYQPLACESEDVLDEMAPND